MARGEHPNEMLLTRDGGRLLVANANLNTVTVLDTATGQALETLSAAMSAEARPVRLRTAWPCRRTSSSCLSPMPGTTTWRCLRWRSRKKPPRSASFRWAGTHERSRDSDGRHLLVANGKGPPRAPTGMDPSPTNRRPIRFASTLVVCCREPEHHPASGGGQNGGGDEAALRAGL